MVHLSLSSRSIEVQIYAQDRCSGIFLRAVGVGHPAQFPSIRSIADLFVVSRFLMMTHCDRLDRLAAEQWRTGEFVEDITTESKSVETDLLDMV